MVITNIRHVRRTLLVGVAVASLLLSGLAGVAATAAPASSHMADIEDVPVTIMSASGCTGHNPQRCINVTGSGLTIDKVKTSWDMSSGNLCKTRMHITYFDINDIQYKQHNSSLSSTCHGNGSWSPGGYPWKAKAGRVCGTVSVDGVKKSGACVKLFA